MPYTEDVNRSRVEAALSRMTAEDTAHLASVLEFEGSLADRLQKTSIGPYVVDSEGMIRVPAVLFAGDPSKVCLLLLSASAGVGMIISVACYILMNSNTGAAGDHSYSDDTNYAYHSWHTRLSSIATFSTTSHSTRFRVQKQY